jgi:hypothetical protein
MGKVVLSVFSAPSAKGEVLGPGQKAPLPFQHIQGYEWLTLSYVSVSSVCETSCTPPDRSLNLRLVRACSHALRHCSEVVTYECIICLDT